MGRALMIVLIFVVVGPLIGLVTLSVLLTIFAAAKIELKEAGDPASLGLFVLMYGLLLAHFIGALWAGIAGALVALRSHLWGKASIFEGIPVGVLTAFASIVTWNLNEVQASEFADLEPPAMAGWVLVHVIPTMACIWLTRGWQGKNPATS